MEMEESNGLPTRKKKSYTYSNLNEDIIHLIFSFLTRREAVKASLSCKSWRRAWTSYPVLKFDETELLPNAKDFAVTEGDFTELISGTVGDSMEKFVSNFNACGNRNNKPVMQKFHLSLFGNTCIKSSLIEKWINMALESRVQDLYIKGSRISKDDLCIPEIVFSAKSLRSLGLMGGVKVPRLEIRDVDLYSLRSLSIDTSFVDPRTLECILLRCPLLEDLHLKCRRVTKIKISGFQNLKTLKVGGFEEVEITKLPRLGSLRTMSRHPSRLMNLSVDDTRNNIKHLEFEVKPHTGMTDTWLREYMSEFPSVERLKVRYFCNPEFLPICLCLPRIKEIHFQLSAICRQDHIHEGKISCLSRFSFSISTQPSASLKAFALRMTPMDDKSESVVKYWMSMANSDEFSLNQKLRQYLSGISQIYGNLNIYIIEEKWDDEGSLNLHREPACVVKQLGLSTIIAKPSRYLAILGDLFSICHPINLHTRAAEEHKNFIKLMCEAFIGRGDGEYWQQQFIAAKIEGITGRKRDKGYGPMDLNALINLLPVLKGYHMINFRLSWIL